jgi:hypothetical protein
MSEPDQIMGISRNLFNSVVEYLMSRPYGEVHSLMQELQQGTKVVSVAADEESSDD